MINLMYDYRAQIINRRTKICITFHAIILFIYQSMSHCKSIVRKLVKKGTSLIPTECIMINKQTCPMIQISRHTKKSSLLIFVHVFRFFPLTRSDREKIICSIKRLIGIRNYYAVCCFLQFHLLFDVQVSNKHFVRLQIRIIESFFMPRLRI